MPAASEDKLQQHMEEAKAKHFGMLAKRVQSLEEKIEQREFSEVNSNVFKEKAVRRERVEADGAMPSGRRYDSGIDNSLRSLPPQQPVHQDQKEIFRRSRGGSRVREQGASSKQHFTARKQAIAANRRRGLSILGVWLKFVCALNMYFVRVFIVLPLPQILYPTLRSSSQWLARK